MRAGKTSFDGGRLGDGSCYLEVHFWKADSLLKTDGIALFMFMVIMEGALLLTIFLNSKNGGDWTFIPHFFIAFVFFRQTPPPSWEGRLFTNMWAGKTIGLFFVGDPPDKPSFTPLLLWSLTKTSRGEAKLGRRSTWVGAVDRLNLYIIIQTWKLQDITYTISFSTSIYSDEAIVIWEKGRHTKSS